tara:strand:+ start:1512 stop:2150 length:639 start_codon:yes stop_codon:yes gene_type:complete
MKNKIISTLILLSVCLSNNESELIKQVYENYRYVILNDSGDNAAKYFDNNSIKWYSDILYHIKNASRDDVNKLNIIQKFTVLIVRGLATEDQISSFDAKSLIVFIINNGLIDKGSVEGKSINNIIINDQFASAEILLNGKNNNSKVEFRKENEKWKLDFTSLINSPMVQKSFDQILEQIIESNESVNNKMDAIYFSLKMTPNVDINKIWKTI